MKNPELNRRNFMATSAATAAGLLATGSARAAAGGFTPHRTTPGATIGAHPPPPFSKAEYQGRLNRVRERMAQDNIDMLFVTMPEDMCYLHGIELNWFQQNGPKAWGMNSISAVHVDHDTLIHFDSHDDLMAATSAAEDIRRPQSGGGRPYEGHAMELEAAGWLKGTVGLQYWSYRPVPARMKQLETVFEARGCPLVDGSDIMAEVRLHKSPAEIDVMMEAARICDIGLQAIMETLQPGVTELEVYGEMVRAMTRAGGGMSGLLSSIKVGGATFLHGIASTRVVQMGDHVICDICGVKNRYHSNTARGFFVGDPPKKLADLYKMNGRAMETLAHHARAGMPLKELTKIMREFYQETGAWQMRQRGEISGYTGGYELGISFPPDWVGWWSFSVGEEDTNDWIIQERQVFNYESYSTGSTALIDTFVHETDRCRRLSMTPADLLVVA